MTNKFFKTCAEHNNWSTFIRTKEKISPCLTNLLKVNNKFYENISDSGLFEFALKWAGELQSEGSEAIDPWREIRRCHSNQITKAKKIQGSGPVQVFHKHILSGWVTAGSFERAHGQKDNGLPDSQFATRLFQSD